MSQQTLVSIADMCRRFERSRATIGRWTDSPFFPAPLYSSQRLQLWRLDEVEEWVRAGHTRVKQALPSDLATIPWLVATYGANQQRIYNAMRQRGAPLPIGEGINDGTSGRPPLLFRRDELVEWATRRKLISAASVAPAPAPRRRSA